MCKTVFILLAAVLAHQIGTDFWPLQIVPKQYFNVMLKVVFIVLAAAFAHQLWNFWAVKHPLRYRFDSFAPVRNQSKVKWFVDGQDYMSAVADAIEASSKEILITDWQMNPYIFMKRPDNGVDSLKWRLDKMLIRKASEGVRVYILLYWETQMALDTGSQHTQSILDEYPNIVVYRHPQSMNSLEQPSTIRWSHHEKIVVVDRSVAFVGGIDLCFGRWDTHDHELMDNYPLHPCAKQDCENKENYRRHSRWVGKDYKNTFFSDGQKTDWDKPYDDYSYIERSQIPRMPWHDVGCAFTGAAVSDAVKHFIQRYNALNPSWWNYWKLRDLPNKLDKSDEYVLPDLSSYTNANVQVIRSVDKWSSGQPHEASIYKAYLYAIENAQKYIYIENQFFISSQPGILMGVKNQIQSALADRIYRAYEKSEDFHVMVVMPLKPEFGPEEWDSSNPSDGLKGISYWNYATLYSGTNSLFHKLRERKMPAWSVKKYFSVYGLRTHDMLSGKLATEIIYVHSKLMIVDDRLTIIGSANINDRSMLGGRDSEVAVIVEDVEMFDGKMKDKSWKVGKFSHNLRCHLHKEHLGLLNMETQAHELNIEDPTVDSFITGISEQANQNMVIYERVFRSKILPTNHVWNLQDLENWKEMQGLADINQMQAEEELKQVHGNIVTFPAAFLKDVLKPSIIDYLQVFVDNRGMARDAQGENQILYA